MFRFLVCFVQKISVATLRGIGFQPVGFHNKNGSSRYLKYPTLLNDRRYQNARSQALAWERAASEALPRACPIQNPACTAVRQAEPAMQ